MSELFTMWRNTRMVVLTAICAAAYVAVLLPFKGFVLVPGLTEVRPGAALPVVLSLLFGPAAAWGSGFGNLIADTLGGMLGPGSLFGFLGNFLYGWVPCLLWRALMGTASPVASGARGWALLVAILAVDSLVIGSVIGWGTDLLGLFPFAALGLIIAVNNFIAAAAIGLALLTLLHGRVARWGLLYHDVMDGGGGPEAFPDEGTGAPPAPAPSPTFKPRARHRLGALLVVVGAVAAFAAGLSLSAGTLGAGWGAAAFGSASAAGSATVSLGMAPGLLLLLVGLVLL